jgi:hypothetical protein
MTLQEYLDPQRFPLTTELCYTPRQQLMMDAFNYDKFKEFVDDGVLQPGRPTALWNEYKAKEPHIPRLTRELAEAQAREREREERARPYNSQGEGQAK